MGFTSGIAFSADAKLLAATTMSSRVVIWDVAERTALSAPEELFTRYGPAFSPDGARLAAGGENGIAVWHDPAAAHSNTLAPYTGHKWKPDERYTFDGKDQLVHTFDSVAFSPDGKWVAAHGLYYAIIWNRKTKKVQQAIPHTFETEFRTVLAFSQDSQRLALGFERCAEIHPVEKKGRVVKLKGHTRYVRGVGFTPDGRTAMTAGSDGMVYFWDAATGKQLRAFDWGIGKLYSAAFSPDGLTCAAGSEAGQIVVWDVDN